MRAMMMFSVRRDGIFVLAAYLPKLPLTDTLIHTLIGSFR